MESARTTLASRDGLYKDISQVLIQALKAKSDPRKLPDNLKSKTAAKAEASIELERAESAAEAIAEELESARSFLRVASEEQLSLAVGSLMGRCETYARQLIELNKKRYRLLFVIEAFAKMQFSIDGIRQGEPGYSPTMIEATQTGQAVSIDGLSFLDVQKRWLTALDEIRHDPNAEARQIL